MCFGFDGGCMGGIGAIKGGGIIFGGILLGIIGMF